MKRKLIITLALCLSIFGSAAAGSPAGVSASAAEAKTGTGLSDHVMKAYKEGWKYSYGAYGQLKNGTRYTDCSGLIKSYLWWTGDKTNPNSRLVSVAGSGSGMLKAAKSKGTIDYSKSSSLPRIHGLILYQPGHVGVYVGNNMAIDNRDVGYNIKYEKVFGRARNKWTTWFKLPQLTYPTTGFADYNGNTYYYENGQYVVSTTRTLENTVYTFDAGGVMVSSAPTPESVVQVAADEVPLVSAAPAAPPAPDPVRVSAGDPVIVSGE